MTSSATNGSSAVCGSSALDASADAPDLLGGELIDLITDRVVMGPLPVDRAEIIVQLLSCAAEAVRWRLEPDGESLEEASLEIILAAALRHRDAMRTSPGAPTS